ncbi:arylsulfatase [Desulfovibrio sp. OttesenSCG-928-M14]|nr:arylsulfatase [Desulfovibrio sp. OttesenSCG-928-M14]
MKATSNIFTALAAGSGSFVSCALLAGQAAAAPTLNAQVMAEDTFPLKTTVIAENMTPVIMHAQDENTARAKLEAFTRMTGKKPNILLYIMDDVGWGDLGCYGGGAMLGAPTPVMDSLAREGVMLTSAYAQPSSSPTRATVLTGRLPVRHGILLPTMYGEDGGLKGEITIAQLLKESGYVTQAIGKWHVGENTESQPQSVGFDDFYGFLSVSDMYTEWRDTNFYPEIALSEARTKMVLNSGFETHLIHTTSKDNGGKYERVKEIDVQASKVMDTDLAEYGKNFILGMKNSKQPFFLYFGTRGAHFDNYPPPAFEGKSFSKSPYRDTMMELDHHLGTLIAALEEIGELDNTIIFITSDNGPEMESWPDAGYSPFRGAKGSFLEGGQRVPGIAYWKGKIEGGRVLDGIFDLADLYNTFATLGGAKLPTDRYIDGIDQTSFLLGDSGQSNRKFMFYWNENTLSAVRCSEFKYHLRVYNDRPLDVVNNGGFSGTTGGGMRMFNLHLDPKEDRSYLIRKLIYRAAFGQGLAEHLATFVKYPAKVPIATKRYRDPPR